MIQTYGWMLVNRTNWQKPEIFSVKGLKNKPKVYTIKKAGIENQFRPFL